MIPSTRSCTPPTTVRQASSDAHPRGLGMSKSLVTRTQNAIAKPPAAVATPSSRDTKGAAREPDVAGERQPHELPERILGRPRVTGVPLALDPELPEADPAPEPAEKAML